MKAEAEYVVRLHGATSSPQTRQLHIMPMTNPQPLSGRALRPRSSKATLLASLVLTAACTAPGEEPQTLRFAEGATDVQVTFHGEVTDADLFGAGRSLLDHLHPLDDKGKRRGTVENATPGWLRFEYQLNDQRREVLVAKQPLVSMVSWEDIARAGASGESGVVALGGGLVIQDARIKDSRGHEYRVRLPTCGQSTLRDLSEWNLLIGAVHRGDMDFSGGRYGWIRKPYADPDLKVGYKGSLSWCPDKLDGRQVSRGYFFVSRLHADDPTLRTTRLRWRPVLERIKPEAETRRAQHLPGASNVLVSWSPSGHAGYAGRISNDELFGPGVGISQLVPVEGGDHIDYGRPDWLRFVHRGKVLLVASKPIRHSVPWEAIAKAGAARGDGSSLRMGWKSYRQDAEVKDKQGKRYRVRLLDCGRHTMDLASEWNTLMGGIHRGDGDFVRHPSGVYGWLDTPFDDVGLGVAVALGGASWCRNTIEIDGKMHGINRGFMTISRWHATPIDFVGDAFGWRPVLELLP